MISHEVLTNDVLRIDATEPVSEPKLLPDCSWRSRRLRERLRLGLVGLPARGEVWPLRGVLLLSASESEHWRGGCRSDPRGDTWRHRSGDRIPEGARHDPLALPDPCPAVRSPAGVSVSVFFRSRPDSPEAASPEAASPEDANPEATPEAPSPGGAMPERRLRDSPSGELAGEAQLACRLGEAQLAVDASLGGRGPEKLAFRSFSHRCSASPPDVPGAKLGRVLDEPIRCGPMSVTLLADPLSFSLLEERLRVDSFLRWLPSRDPSPLARAWLSVLDVPTLDISLPPDIPSPVPGTAPCTWRCDRRSRCLFFRSAFS